MASAIRVLSLDAVAKAESGHPGMPIGMADVATVLFSKFLKFNCADPNWPDRDRFVISAGHGSMLLYSLLYLAGYKDMTIEEIKNFRRLHSKAAGHPEHGLAAGIENTSGPLGQGFANAVGMAISERILSARFGNDLVDHYTYVIAGDGCLMEGISHEAASLAGHLGLDKLVLFFDSNDVSIDGNTDLAVSDNYLQRFAAYGWHICSIYGHDYTEIEGAISRAKSEKSKPSIIECKTIIGKFIPNKAGTSGAHSWPIKKEEILGMRKNLNWHYAPFVVPQNILDSWRDLSSIEEYNLWRENASSNFIDYMDCKISENISEILSTINRGSYEATRKSSGDVLDILTRYIPQLVGGSADLSGSNNTKASCMKVINKDDFSGSYIHYGVREHAMAACMNGMALHGGVIPYGGTFLVFTDYCRPAIRLSALMKQRVIYIMTHDSIGLGEDGPTHQPIEHLPSLRAMPNTYVFRPADAAETAGSWLLALQSVKTPSVLVLSRQPLPQVYSGKRNMVSYGGYIISESEHVLKITIFATGSEVQIALEVQSILKDRNVGVRVVSMPCIEIFDQQSQEYRDSILKNDSVKVAIEAASGYGWEKYIGQNGKFIGLDSFGESADSKTLYKHFRITAEDVVKLCEEKINL